jgi:uncharacterized membrane protein
MVRAHRTGDVRVIAAVSRDVVRADLLFTASAVVIQPVSGVGLMLLMGYSWCTPWLFKSMILYALIGCCWLPVVWLQVQMRNLAQQSAVLNGPLPDEYHRYYRWWFTLGWPAFVGVMAVFYLMVAKPG